MSDSAAKRLWTSYGVASVVALGVLLSMFEGVTVRSLHVAIPCALLLGYGVAWLAGRRGLEAERRDDILETISSLTFLLVAMAVLSEALRRYAPGLPVALRYLVGLGLPLALRWYAARRADGG